jgi:Fe-S cluster assembly iron-binding protein IscA
MDDIRTSRRSFIKCSAAILAAVGGISLPDILRAEAVLPQGRLPTLDPKAAQCIRDVASAHLSNMTWFLRLGIEGDEVSGFQACMGFTNETTEADTHLRLHNIPVVIHRDSIPAFSDMVIVLGEREGRKGFIFEGPLFERRKSANKAV